MQLTDSEPLVSRETMPNAPSPAPVSDEFWRVYNYIAKHWYDDEYGIVEGRYCWYYPAMLFLESLAHASYSSPSGVSK